MKEQKLYVCEGCNTSYKKKDDAIFCEKQHIKANSIKTAKYHSKSYYPDYVEVLFDDGKTVRYKK